MPKKIIFFGMCAMYVMFRICLYTDSRNAKSKLLHYLFIGNKILLLEICIFLIFDFCISDEMRNFLKTGVCGTFLNVHYVV